MEEPLIGNNSNKTSCSSGIILALSGTTLTVGALLLSYALTLAYQESALNNHPEMHDALETSVASILWNKDQSSFLLSTLPPTVGILYFFKGFYLTETPTQSTHKINAALSSIPTLICYLLSIAVYPWKLCGDEIRLINTESDNTTYTHCQNFANATQNGTIDHTLNEAWGETQQDIMRDSVLFSVWIGIAITFTSAMLINTAVESLLPCKPCKLPPRKKSRQFKSDEPEYQEFRDAEGQKESLGMR